MVNWTKTKNKIITYSEAGIGLGFVAMVSGCSYFQYSNQENHEKVETINQELSHLEDLIVNNEDSFDKWVDSSKILMDVKLKLISTQEYKSEEKKVDYGGKAVLGGFILIAGCLISKGFLRGR